MERTGNGADFNGQALMARLEEVRGKAQMSWREVGREAHVSASTFTQLRAGHLPDTVTLGRLLEWLGERPWWMTTAS